MGWISYLLIDIGIGYLLLALAVAWIVRRDAADLTCALFVASTSVISGALAFFTTPDVAMALYEPMHLIGVTFMLVMWLMAGRARRLALSFTYLFSLVLDFTFWDAVANGHRGWSIVGLCIAWQNALFVMRLFLIAGGRIRDAVTRALEAHRRRRLVSRAGALHRGDNL